MIARSGFQSRWPQAVAQQTWASCSLHPGPGLTQPSILSGSVNEYRLQLGRYKAGMCDAAWCAPCTWAPLQWAVPTQGCYSKCSTLPYLTLAVQNSDELIYIWSLYTRMTFKDIFPGLARPLTLRARGTSYLVQYWYWLCATYEITRTPLQQSYHVSSASVIQSAAL